MNILIIKTGALGDVLRTSFLAQALKDKYSNEDSKIYWITDKKAKPIFINNSYIDELLTSEEKNKLINIKFDIVINLEEDEENCKFTSSLNAKQKIGFLFDGKKIFPSETTRELFDMSMLGKKPQNDILKKQNKKTHRQIIGEIVGVEWQKYEPFLRLNKFQRKLASDFMRRHNLSFSDKIFGINTGSADRWPKSLSTKKTAELIDKLYKKYNAKIILFGGPNEIERNKEIHKYSKSPIIDAGCGNDLVEFPAIVSACNYFITSDSLGLHIALALKRKTIALIGPTSSSELDMFSIGEKIIADSNCLCCYKKDCKSMDKIDLQKIIKSIDKLSSQKITLVITAFKEKSIGKAIESALNQKTNYPYEILVSVPDKETIEIVKKYNSPKLKIFQDPGKGKSTALNLIFKNTNSDILILTDGDVFISENSVQEICDLFQNPQIGCITGRPVPIENKENKYGYWANFLFHAAHLWRRDAFIENKFIECSGYLFAFRKNKINQIPLDVAEDTIIPYYFWEMGYQIGYAEKAEVYVKNVDNWKDWVNQKTRTTKAHETLNKYVNTKMTPRVKSFKNESRGVSLLFSYPKNIKQFFWGIELAFARLYMWWLVFWDTKLKDKNYQDAWQRVESTK